MKWLVVSIKKVVTGNKWQVIKPLITYYFILNTVLLTACEVGPDYHLPDLKLPGSWTESKAEQNQKIVEADWWKQFHDPVLDGLIDKALAQNFDLKIAEARIKQARATVIVTRADLAPTVNATGSFEREANQFAFGSETFPKPFNTFQTGFDASWELDLFGGHRRDLESARALYKASEFTRDNIRVSLLAEVAREYIEVRKLQAEIAVAKEAIANEQDNARIQEELYKNGNSSETNATEARAQLLLVGSELINYENNQTTNEYALDVLLGEKPGYVKSVIGETKPIDVADKNIVLLAPAEVMIHRPDIRAAERQLASATAQIGVAESKLFPDISLSAFFGLFSTSTNTLLRSSAKSWNIGGNILWPIFNYGKIKAGVDAAKAEDEEALLNYKKTLLSALADVETSVLTYAEEEQSRQLTDKAVAEDQRQCNIAQEQFKVGVSGYSQVISAKRSLYGAKLQAVTSSASSAEGFIAVYKSLGGGWQGQKKDGNSTVSPQVSVVKAPPQILFLPAPVK